MTTRLRYCNRLDLSLGFISSRVVITFLLSANQRDRAPGRIGAWKKTKGKVAQRKEETFMPVTLIFIGRHAPGDGGSSLPPETFLNKTFFPRESYFIGRFCQVDSRKARSWIAPVVKRGQIGRVVAREPSRRSSSKCPKFAPSAKRAWRTWTIASWANRLLAPHARRTAGRHRGSRSHRLGRSGHEKNRADDLELVVHRHISYLLDDGSTETLSYGTVTPIVPATLWDVPTGDPIKDLSAAAATIITNSGLVPNGSVWGRGARGVPEQQIVQEQLNKLHFVAGGI